MDEVEKWVGIKVKTTSSDEKDQAATTRSNTTGKKYIPSNNTTRDTNDKRDETTMRMRRETKQRQEQRERQKRRDRWRHTRPTKEARPTRDEIDEIGKTVICEQQGGENANDEYTRMKREKRQRWEGSEWGKWWKQKTRARDKR